MPIDDQELRAIQFLAERVRKATSGAKPWDSAGLAANLRKLAGRNLHMTIEHVLRHAADPAAKTPGVLAGSFTPEAPTPEQFRPPKAHEACGVCNGFRGSCPCAVAGRAVDDGPPSPDLPPVADVNPTLAARLAKLAPSEERA